MKNIRRNGFTLVELLVVIAVLAILIALVVPLGARTVERARSTQCQGNLKQWGVYWHNYLGDHNGKFSRGLTSISRYYDRTHDTDVVRVNNLNNFGSGWARGEWCIVLKDYFGKNASFLQCPSATERLYIDGKLKVWGSYDKTYKQGNNVTDPSYGVNCWVYNPPFHVYRKDNPSDIRRVTHVQGRKVENHWRNLANHRNADQIPLILDAMWRGGGPGDNREKQRFYLPPSYNGQWTSYGHEMQHFALDRHYGAINGVFADGSVRRIPVHELWSLKWHRDYDTTFGDRITLPPWIRALPKK